MASDRSVSAVLMRLLFVGLALLSSSLTLSCALETSGSGVQLLRGGPGRRMLLRHGGETDPYAVGKSEKEEDSPLERPHRGLSETTWMDHKEDGKHGWWKNGMFHKKDRKPCSPPDEVSPQDYPSTDEPTPVEDSQDPFPSKDNPESSSPEEETADSPMPDKEDPSISDDNADSPMPDKEDPSLSDDNADSPMPAKEDPSLSDDNADSPMPAKEDPSLSDNADSPTPEGEDPSLGSDDKADSPMPDGEDPSLSDNADSPMPEDGAGPGAADTMPYDEQPKEDMPLAASVDASKFAVPEEVSSLAPGPMGDHAHALSPMGEEGEAPDGMPEGGDDLPTKPYYDSPPSPPEDAEPTPIPESGDDPTPIPCKKGPKH